MLNGTSAEARFPFLVPQATSGPGPSPPPLPPLLFVDVSSGQEHSLQGSRSLRNLEEVRAVHQLVVSLLRQGVKPSQIGITSLYRSQVFALREAVSGISVKPIVQQPQDATPRTPTKRKKGAAFSQPPQQDSTAVASGLGIQVSTVDAFQVSFFALETSKQAGLSALLAGSFFPCADGERHFGWSLDAVWRVFIFRAPRRTSSSFRFVARRTARRSSTTRTV